MSRTKVNKILSELRLYFLANLPDNRKKIASDNLLSLLDKLEDTIDQLKDVNRKEKKITLISIGNTKPEDLFDKLLPIIEEKFSNNTLTALPQISLDDIKIYKVDENNNVLDADIVFEIRGFSNGKTFSAKYPIYIVDGYIRDNGLIYQDGIGYSMKDFFNRIQNDFVMEPEPELHYINERGFSDMFSEALVGSSTTEVPYNHIWDPYRWR